MVTTRLDETTLRQVAEATGGRYVRVAPGATAFEELVDEIAAGEGDELDTREITQFEEQYQLFLWPWPSRCCLSKPWSRNGDELRMYGVGGSNEKDLRLLHGKGASSSRPACSLCTLSGSSPGPVAGQQGRSQVKEGNRLYSEGRFDDAHQKYLEALLEDPESPLIRFNDGNALYQSRGSSKERWSATWKQRRAGTLPFKVPRGTTSETPSSEQQQLQESLEAYKQALRTNPSDLDAKHNLERVLEQLQQQEQQDQGEGEDQEQNQDDQENSRTRTKGQGQQDPRTRSPRNPRAKSLRKTRRNREINPRRGNRAQRANLRKERGVPNPNPER